MDRIEEIRERLTLTTDMGGEYLVPLEIVEEDIPYLLERIDELQKHADGWGRAADAYMEANNKLKERVAELERENGRLKKANERTDKRAYVIVRKYNIDFKDGKWLRELLFYGRHPEAEKALGVNTGLSGWIT